jgi:hypothetical protein
VKPPAGASGEGNGSRVGHTANAGADRHRPRVTRDCHPAVIPSPKAVRWSRDRGRNSHRILRRVPDDGRHSGSSRSVGFHEQARTVILAVSTSSDPYVTNQKKDVRPGCSTREAG